MFNFKEMPKTAVEAVEASRRVATGFINMIPDQTTQSFYANLSNAQFGIATVFAEQTDKSVEQFKKMFVAK